jgi:hypothetical protein
MPEDAGLSFVEFLNGFRRGDLLAEADAQLGEVLDAIRASGGRGSLTITLPFKLNDAGQIECVPSVTAKKPRRPLGTGIYYVNDEGRLTRRDPNQPDFLDEMAARRGADRRAE